MTVTETSAVITWFTGDSATVDEFGRPAPAAAPGRVLIGTSPNPTTLVPPPGREIGRVAELNDLHFGEGASGLAIGNDVLPGGRSPALLRGRPERPVLALHAESRWS